VNRRAFLLAAGTAPFLRGQGPLLRRAWTGRWVSTPQAPATAYAVCLFRRSFDLAARPERFVVHVSADQRYQLAVNGKRVAWGPARGDLFHWRYETVDLAPFLNAGRNVLAATVWNFGDDAPEAQVTLRTGFVLEGDNADSRIADTGPAWRCAIDRAYGPILFSSDDMRGYYVAGPGDRVNAALHPWGWETAAFDDSSWSAPTTVSMAAGREARDPHTRWMLIERTIPLMEERAERLQQLRRSDGVTPPAAFPAQPAPFVIEANTTATLLLDQTWLTTAYPELTVSGGAGATIRMRYAESLFIPAPPNGRVEKGNRNEVEGKVFIGNHDEFTADGGPRRTFRPLWWRTYRYLELVVATRGEPLTIEDLAASYTGYPFQRLARFDAGVPELNRILDTGWRTARLCAHETYMDCPYYEQLQYAGDTRIQCLVSLFETGDARLMRNAIDLLNVSRQSDGCTMSRYPTRLEQYIPGFALWWIGMLHDYWWYVNDPEFVRRTLPGVRAVLSFFERYQKPNGSLGLLPWWRYFDWVPGWTDGEPPMESDGGSAIFDLHLTMAYGWAAAIESAIGLSALGSTYAARERQLRATVQSLYWDDARRLYADTAQRKEYSQHANTMAVLADAITGEAARDLMLRILTEPGLAKGELYFKHYIHTALAKVGEGDRYLGELDDWRTMLASGLTTFAEIVDRPGSPSRSDCHAWSASPNIAMLRTVLGVDSAAPGWGRVTVRPHLGTLAYAEGSVPHPAGLIEARVEAGGTVSVTLPPGVSGTLEWRSQTRELSPGANRFSIV
jgi:hypothetical protein